MRVAFVQGGEGLASVEDQVATLGSVAPDRYHIEEQASGPAQQRVLEMLDGLACGDELVVASLATFRSSVDDTIRLIHTLVDRGVGLRLVDEAQGDTDVGGSLACRRLLASMAALQPRPDDADAAPGATAGPELLTEVERADIRRLGRAGLSPRRIGLIYRRSPKCILEVLSGAEGAEETVSARRSA